MAILVPSLFVMGVILFSFIPHRSGIFTHAEEHLTLSVIIVAGIVPFTFLVLRIFRRIETHILQQNEELLRHNRQIDALLKVGRAAGRI